MSCPLLEVLVPAAISALLFCTGIQCRTSEYSLEVPSQVTVQDGLCVHIPCRFTYPASHVGRIYGNWYVKDRQDRRPRLVATNNPSSTHRIDPRDRGRFEVSGPTLNSGDCSLTINDAEAADQATYVILVEKVHRRWSSTVAKKSLSVIVTERKLDITTEQPLRAGQRTSIICKYEICSSPGVLATSWSYPAHLSVLDHVKTENHGSVEDHIDFILTAADHQQNVTCEIVYGSASNQRRVETTVTLNVHYAPRILPFSGHRQAPGGDVRTFSNVSNGKIDAWAGESLLVLCEADANPPSSDIWSWTRRHSFGIAVKDLKISDVSVEDSGKYVCEATNQEGTSKAPFYLHVQDDDDYSPMMGP